MVGSYLLWKERDSATAGFVASPSKKAEKKSSLNRDRREFEMCQLLIFPSAVQFGQVKMEHV